MGSRRIIIIWTRHESFTPRYVLFNLFQYNISVVQVITTRSYDERLGTITAVRDAGISVCSGGILGLGESDADRVGLIWEVSKCVYYVLSLCSIC